MEYMSENLATENMADRKNFFTRSLLRTEKGEEL